MVTSTPGTSARYLPFLSASAGLASATLAGAFLAGGFVVGPLPDASSFWAALANVELPNSRQTSAIDAMNQAKRACLIRRFFSCDCQNESNTEQAACADGRR